MTLIRTEAKAGAALEKENGDEQKADRERIREQAEVLAEVRRLNLEAFGLRRGTPAEA